MLSDVSIKKSSRPASLGKDPHLLLISSSKADGNDIEGILAAQGYAVSRCDCIRKSKLILGSRSVDLILLDMDLMTEHVKSYYAASANKHAPYPTLTEQLECDVCVIRSEERRVGKEC